MDNVVQLIIKSMIAPMSKAETMHVLTLILQLWESEYSALHGDEFAAILFKGVIDAKS